MVRFSRSGSRQDFRIDRALKLLASFATAITFRYGNNVSLRYKRFATAVVDRVRLCDLKREFLFGCDYDFNGTNAFAFGQTTQQIR